MPLVYRLSYRMLRNQSEAEDASQEVFLRMHRSFDTFDPTRPLAPWVARITYHVALRRLESSVSGSGDGTPAPQNEMELIADQAHSPEQAMQSVEAEQLLVRAMEELSAQDRALLDLRYREGLSDAEVSEATGMPVNTVKTRIFRARGKLRGLLGPLLREE